MVQLETREKVKQYLTEGKFTPKEITKLLGVSQATVYRVIKKIKDEESLQHKRGAGRPLYKRNAIKKSVGQYIRHDSTRPVRELASVISDKIEYVSKSTVHRCLTHLGYNNGFPKPVPLLSEKTRLKRIKWAKKNEKKWWINAIFSDVASFWLLGGRVKMWSKQGHKRFQPTVKHSAKVNIYPHIPP